MTFPEENNRQDNADILQDPPIVACRPISILKSNQASGKGDRKCGPGEEHYTIRELGAFANSFKQKS